MEELQQLQQQAGALRVEMPEQSSLALALDRVEVWQVGDESPPRAAGGGSGPPNTAGGAARGGKWLAEHARLLGPARVGNGRGPGVMPPLGREDEPRLHVLQPR